MNREEERLLEESALRSAGRRLFHFYRQPHNASTGTPGPYPWQIEFHNAGAIASERMLMAANQVGKTMCAAAEMAMHLTGEYPPWWQGRRFVRPIKAWCGSESSEMSRDVIQLALLGSEGQHGSGWVPLSRLIGPPKYRQAGVADVVDMFYVRHSSGGISACSLKTYEQERRKWAGPRIHVIWLDEEPSMEIYTEALTRTANTQGIVYLTFTPLLGSSAVVRHFIEAKTPSIYVKNVSWNDAPHIDEKRKEELAASYPEHERETRTSGQPMLGTGAIFPIADSSLAVDLVEIPKHWARINGIDFGIDHPAAGVWCAHDRDTDTFYVYDCYKMRGQTPVYHAAALKKHGDWIPIAWPHDGLQRDKGSGEPLMRQYRKHGLAMLPQPAQYPDERGHHVEPGLIEMLEYMKTNRFKVFRHCQQWFEERRLYHRKDGLAVKEFDDLMSATRYAFIMRRMARTAPPVLRDVPGPTQPMAGPGRWRA